MDEPPIVPLSGKTNVAIVRESLEEIIQSGFWKPGDKLPTEAELCVRYNVGRSTVREAINMLKARNLLHTVAGQGTFVSVPQKKEFRLTTHVLDPKSDMDLLNIMELRLSLEPMNAVFAARRATPEQIAEMRKCNEVLAGALQEDADLFARTDMVFHMLVAKATANPILADVMETVRRFFLEQQVLTSRREPRRETALDFHHKLFEAIVNRDERAAEDVMRAHMDDTYIYAKSLVDTSDRRSGRWIPRHTKPPARALRRKKG